MFRCTFHMKCKVKKNLRWIQIFKILQLRFLISECFLSRIRISILTLRCHARSGDIPVLQSFSWNAHIFLSLCSLSYNDKSRKVWHLWNLIQYIERLMETLWWSDIKARFSTRIPVEHIPWKSTRWGIHNRLLKPRNRDRNVFQLFLMCTLAATYATAKQNEDWNNIFTLYPIFESENRIPLEQAYVPSHHSREGIHRIANNLSKREDIDPVSYLKSLTIK